MRGRDHGERVRATRSGRMRGCYIYIDAESLRKAGLDPEATPPFYRVWAGRGGRFVVSTYSDK